MMTWLKLPFHVFGAFLRWWLAELAGLVPRGLRRPLTGRGETVVLEPAGDVEAESGSLFLRRGEEVEALGSFGEGLAALPAKARRGHRTVTLALPPTRAVTQRVRLPLAAEDTLRDVIGFEMDRLTPFSREEVYYDQRVLGRDAEQQQLEVELTLSPKATVDTFLEQAGRLGLTPERVDVATPEPGKPMGLDLLQREVRRGPGGFARAITLLLLLTAAGLGAATVLIPLERKARLAERLRAEVTAARKDAAAARQLEGELSAQQAQVLYVHELKLATPTKSAILDNVTKVLPDDTWLYQLRVNDDRLEISGYAPNSSSLIQLFEDAAGFAEPKFRAPVTQDPKLGVDRFSLELKILAGRGERS